jgi:hypothetical protein
MATWGFGLSGARARPRDASDAAGPLVRLAEPAAAATRGPCLWRLASRSSLFPGQRGRRYASPPRCPGGVRCVV